MIQKTSELEGFVVFANVQKVLRLTVSTGSMRISVDAAREIGDPQYINIFFDDNKKRMAIKAATKSMENVFRITNTKVNNMAIIRDKILKLLEMELVPAGSALRFIGSKTSSGYIIFDLTKSQQIQFSRKAEK